jgi:hypothetical protein
VIERKTPEEGMVLDDLLQWFLHSSAQKGEELLTRYSVEGKVRISTLPLPNSNNRIHPFSDKVRCLGPGHTDLKIKTVKITECFAVLFFLLVAQ